MKLKNIFKLIAVDADYEVYRNEAHGLELWASPGGLTIYDANGRPVGVADADGWRYGRSAGHANYDERHQLRTTLVVEWFTT